MVLLSVAMPAPSRERLSATVTLVALALGALAAGTATVAAQPRVTTGSPSAAADVTVLAAQAPAPAVLVAPLTITPTSAPEPTTTTRQPPPPSTTSSSPRPAPAASGPTAEVVALVNAERAKAGCRALVVDPRLVAAAQGHSTDMATNNYFSHTSRDGRSFADRIRAAGYPRPAAENIAKGQRSAERVMRAWMNSSGHRANILNCSYTAIGVGLDTRGWYWTQNFGR